MDERGRKMDVLACVMCFVNGAVLAGLCVFALMRRGRRESLREQTQRLNEQKAQQEEERKRLLVQWENLLGYGGSALGQKEVTHEE